MDDAGPDQTDKGHSVSNLGNQNPETVQVRLV